MSLTTKLYRRRNLGVHEDVIFFEPVRNDRLRPPPRISRALLRFRAPTKNEGARVHGGPDFLSSYVREPLFWTLFGQRHRGVLELSNEIIVHANQPRPRSIIYCAPKTLDKY